ncbi:MAG: hypothetical protein M1375_04400 [Candidatus Thermoplasmatota archaeon]|jgi:hypothetical protein|nr:hypothetical protein [Candidatus Thermoplasmatota archaeon]MCL5791194.1 hypothetical protein [Candidatus Thermoplasmatota archaeon]
MRDYSKISRFIPSRNVTVICTYRHNFDAERNCGSMVVYEGKEITDESFELFMEYLECGLNEEALEKRINKFVEEIESGRIDVTF